MAPDLRGPQSRQGRPAQGDRTVPTSYDGARGLPNSTWTTWPGAGEGSHRSGNGEYSTGGPGLDDTGLGRRLALATQDAEELLEEAGQLDYVHPADVVALQDGAEEAPAEPEGDFDTTESTCSCKISGQWHTSFTLGGNHCDS